MSGSRVPIGCERRHFPIPLRKRNADLHVPSPMRRGRPQQIRKQLFDAVVVPHHVLLEVKLLERVPAARVLLKRCPHRGCARSTSARGVSDDSGPVREHVLGDIDMEVAVCDRFGVLLDARFGGRGHDARSGFGVRAEEADLHTGRGEIRRQVPP